MPADESLREAVNRLVFPAVNVLRGIELDLTDHPDCPYRAMSVKATANLMALLELAQKVKAPPE